MEKELLECVPNISEGKNPTILKELTSLMNAHPEVNLLHIDAGYDAHRTVFTLVGNPAGIMQTMLEVYDYVDNSIDMRNHRGVHPRLGAIDVCPFIPVRNIKLDKLKKQVIEFAENLASSHLLPVYLYEESALYPERRDLANIRRGEYESLMNRMQSRTLLPDIGPTCFHPRMGATVIGARNFLIAYNIHLKTKDISIAKKIATLIRTARPLKMEPAMEKKRREFSLPGLKAIGWYMDAYGMAQVSTNIVDITKVSMAEVYTVVKKAAQDFNVEVVGSELIGMIPLEALSASAHFLQLNVEETYWIEKVIDSLGLNYLSPFQINDRVIDLAVKSFNG